ncbi:MAG: hypothetical protein LZF62_240009 [Nitrospira sp.]|nr:MAG: hypothetical protein LZF62_240009 [Nitrospira sp.]
MGLARAGSEEEGETGRAKGESQRGSVRHGSTLKVCESGVNVPEGGSPCNSMILCGNNYYQRLVDLHHIPRRFLSLYNRT